MSAFSWLRRLGLSTCPSEPSAPAGCRFGADRAASPFFDSLRVGRGLLPVLLGLYALFGFVATAAAQTTPTANDDGSYSVPYDWALKPSGFSGGERFRLIFITSTTRDVSATGIGTYNTFVQGRAAAGHTAIRPYSSTFRVLGSTSTVDARDNTSTRGSRGVPIYWLNGPKVADTYADFYDGSWDNQRADLNRNESGTAQQSNNVGTGSNGDGTKHTSNHFGEASVQMGQPHSFRDPISYSAGVRTTSVRFYGLSPVFVVTPPPDVSVHASDAIGREGGGNWAGVELRLARALESGETLTVDYSIDIGLGAVNENHNGVSVTRAVASGVTSGTLTITGPNAPQSITLRLRPAANSVNRWESAVKTVEFKLTGVSGVAGAEAVAGADSAKVFVNDSAVSRYTYLNVSGASTNATTTNVVDGATTVRLDGSIVEEGGKVLILLDGKAGRKQNTGRPYEPHNVTVGVQHLTTDFDDLGEAHRGHDAFVGFLRRDVATKTDYYNVGVLGMGFSAEMWIPVNADAAGEGDERFRVFIAGTPDYMGVEGAYNATNDRAPGVDFTIRGQPGGGQRDEPPRPEPAPAPSEAVSNVRVTAVDAASAKVTWDAVERATSYEVEYETTSALVDENNYVQGVAFDWTDTSWTFRHDAAEAMTLTVTVTPSYEDENGDTRVLRDLAGTATVEVGPAGTGTGDSTKDGAGGDTDNVDSQIPSPPPASCVSDEQWSTVAGYYDSNANRSPNYGANWYRVLIAYRLARPEKALPGWEGATAEPTAAYTADEAEDGEEVWPGWTPVREVLECLEKPQTPAPRPEPPPPPPEPELSLSAGSAVDEGASASFTIHADSAPSADLTVSFTVAQSGDWLDSPGAGTRTVILAAGATTAGIDVATVNDSADEPDGSISLTLDTGTGYTVAVSPNDTATVAVRDDDDPPPPPPAIAQGTCVSVAQWNTVKGYYDSNANRSPNYGANWYRVLIAYRQDRTDQTLPAWVGQTAEPTAAFTAAAAGTEESKWGGWTPVRIVLQCLEKTYGSSTDSVIGGIPAMGQSGAVGTETPDAAKERNRWNPQTGPRGFEPNVVPDFAAGNCISPQLRSEAAARASETWRGAAHVERWLRVGRTFSGGANDATVVTPAEAHFHAAAGQPGWLPVADALRCLEQQSLREALSR